MTILTHSTEAMVRQDGILRPLGARLQRTGQWLWRAWGHYRASRAMQGLSPEMLKDIGVSFAEIDAVVRNGRPSRQLGPKRGSRL